MKQDPSITIQHDENQSKMITPSKRGSTKTLDGHNKSVSMNTYNYHNNIKNCLLMNLGKNIDKLLRTDKS
jgi:hypothetical protein